MRNQRSIELDPGRLVTVQELRVRDVRRLLPVLADPTLQGKPLLELLQQHLPALLALLGDSLTLPPGEAIDDLALSECEVIGRVWWDLHRDFLLPLLAALGAPGSVVMPSTAPAAP